jgi:hypothetical protein
MSLRSKRKNPLGSAGSVAKQVERALYEAGRKEAKAHLDRWNDLGKRLGLSDKATWKRVREQRQLEVKMWNQLISTLKK